MTRSASTKNNYQIMIRTYLGRREKLRQKYSYCPGVANPEYRKAIQAINNKLRTWRRAIRRIECRQERLHSIAQLLEDFIGIKMWGCIKLRSKEATMARNLFYKYCREHGFTSPEIMRYLGSDNKYWASHARMTFIRSFATNPENREMWQRFSRYMKEYTERSSTHAVMCEANDLLIPSNQHHGKIEIHSPQDIGS